MRNEDAVYPDRGGSSAFPGLFIVCDGVGGAPGGEVASEITCRSIPGYFIEQNLAQVNTMAINNAITYACDQMVTHASRTSDLSRMCTTLALLYVAGYKVYAVWIGDSRIYQVRKGKVMFRSKDHSLVQEMVDRGVIRPEEASKHSMKNVVTRVLGPGHTHVEAEIVQLTDLEESDQFLLCSDGVMDGIEESELISIMTEGQTLDAKTEIIDSRCREYSRDNYSVILVELKR
jgi:protein phosphatase